MPFTSITPMYADDGVTVVDPNGTVLFGDVSAWDTLILEMRQATEGIAQSIGAPAPTWTRGNSTTLRPDLQPGEDDGVYLSHIQDLRNAISELEQRMFPLGPWSIWTDDPLKTTHDPRRAVYITELQSALYRLQGYTVSTAANLKIKRNGVVVGG